MSHIDIIRAWKDAEYRHSLSEAERAALPENPAGQIELNHAQLEGVAGGLPKTFNLACATLSNGTECTVGCKSTTVEVCGACF
jgi:mersacidin/lichenicidin family type 2 lantibiotic